MKIQKFKGRVQIGTFLYIIAYSLFIARVAIGNTTFSEYISIYGINLIIVFLTGFLCICIKMIMVDKYALRIIIPLVIIVAIFFIGYRNSSYIDIIILLLLLVGARNVKLDDIVKCHFVIYFTIMILAIFCSLIGLIDNYSIYSTLRGYRYSLGNTYPTDFAAGILYLMLDFIYLKRNKWRSFYSIFLILLSWAVYAITDANTNFILCFFSVMVVLIYQTAFGRKIFNSGLFRKVVGFSFWIFATISIYIQYAYMSLNNSIISIVDVLFNNRIAYGYLAIKKYGLSLFGTRIELVGAGWGTNTSNSYFYVDNGYLQLTLIFGLIGLIILCCGFTFVCYLNKFSTEKNRGVLMIIMFVIAVSAILEPRFYNILYNSFILAISISFYSSTRIKRSLNYNR